MPRLPIPFAMALLAIPFAMAAGMPPPSAAPRPGTVELARAGDGLFYATATVNGRPVRFLVDTGANVMLLTAADARRVGAARAPAATRLATAGGSAAMAWTRLDTVELAGRRLAGVQAGVVAHGLPVSLLGQDMLSRFAVVTIAGDRMRME